MRKHSSKNEHPVTTEARRSDKVLAAVVRDYAARLARTPDDALLLHHYSLLHHALPNLRLSTAVKKKKSAR